MAEKKEKPKGVFIFGIVIIFLGVLSLLNYFALDSERYGQILKEMGQQESQILAGREEVGVMRNLSLFFSAFLLFFGSGIFGGKEYARKAMVYFSLVVVGVFILTLFIQPASVVMAFPQFLLFSGIILYFTNKDVRDFFLKESSKES